MVVELYKTNIDRGSEFISVTQACSVILKGKKKKSKEMEIYFNLSHSL